MLVQKNIINKLEMDDKYFHYSVWNRNKSIIIENIE